MPYPKLALPNTFNWLGFLVSMFNERNLFPSSYPEKSASSLFPSNIFILLTRLAGSVWRAAIGLLRKYSVPSIYIFLTSSPFAINFPSTIWKPGNFFNKSSNSASSGTFNAFALNSVVSPFWIIKGGLAVITTSSSTSGSRLIIPTFVSAFTRYFLLVAW